jgi:hypothetical protein
VVTANPNPKNDALIVLQIMLNSCPVATFNKNWMAGKIAEVAATKDPYKLLKGTDYTDYLNAKQKPIYRKTD